MLKKDLPYEVLIEISEILKKICAQNIEFADNVIEEITNPSIKHVSFHKEKDNLFVIKLLSTAVDNNKKYNIKYELKINDYDFQLKKTNIDKNIDNLIKEEYILSCKRNSQQSIFLKEYFFEQKFKGHNDIPISEIESNNQIDIFDDVQQLSHEENEVHITCLPSSKGITQIKKELDKKGLVMKVTNPLALKLLGRLGYNILSVEKNRSKHTQVWPILENSVVQLQKEESVNYDEIWDGYYNGQTITVGDNEYDDHKHIGIGSMYWDYSSEERNLAKQYFNGNISIEEVLNYSEILLNEREKSKGK